jgi:predicted nucleotidyltransferase
LETSARLDATSDADVDDLIERLSNAKGSGDCAGVAKELRNRLMKIDVAADLETPVTIKAPSLNDVPKQPGPEIGR